MRTECQAHVHSDIVVCGGGPAGIMTAVSAARMGCKVSIIEHFGFFGGASVAFGDTGGLRGDTGGFCGGRILGNGADGSGQPVKEKRV